MKRANRLAFLLIIMLALVSCGKSDGTLTSTGADATFVANSYQTLDVAGKSVDTAMKSIAMLYKAGQFSEANKAMAVSAANQFKLSYDSAVDALLLYSTTPTAANKSAVTAALVNVGVQVAAVVALNIVTAK